MAEKGDSANEYKVFVSRIPSKWSEQLFLEHFVTLGFGKIKRVELFVSRRALPQIKPKILYCYTYKNEGACNKENCPYAPCNGLPHEDEQNDGNDYDGVSLGSGLVVFEEKEGMNAALAQRSMHVARKMIKISPYADPDSRDTNLCHAWAQFKCKHGDRCKFLHEGEGACEKQSERYQGRHFQCLSFRTKGKCSKGEACQFLHDMNSVKKKSSRSNRSIDTKDDNISENCANAGHDGKKGICNTYKKKGKCRKGDRCPYSHDKIPRSKKNDEENITSIGEGAGSGKKRKIDGKFLVENRATKIRFDN